MNPVLQSAFNLFFNAACSFFVGALIVWCVIRIFRINQSRWKLALYFLPFLKIIWDVVYRRIPSSSIIHTGIDPFSLPPKSQMLTIGAGFSDFAPVLNVVFLAETPDGKRYSTSFGDYLYFLISRHFGASVPSILFVGFGVVSVGFIARRLYLASRFEQRRRIHRKTDQSLTRIPCDLRSIDVYISPHFEGTPFTGGVLNPYICFPERTFNQLSPEERKAVIDHEVAHVKQWDLVGTFFVQVLGDLFWFVPGYRILSRKIDRLREVLADDLAIQSGAKPEFLAAALIRLQDATTGETGAVLYSAFFREKNLLKERVHRLVSGDVSALPRFGWGKIWVKSLVTFFTVGMVMISTFGENHEVRVTDFSSWMDFLPRWVAGLLKAWGFH